MNNDIYKLTEDYVTNLFRTNPRPGLIFHTLDHTKQIVNRVQEIATHYNLGEKETMTVVIAAWFHDTGHLFTGPEGHEEKSVELMKMFMQKNGTDPEAISVIEGCILATKRGGSPSTLLQQIVHDADTYHLGTREFKKTNKLVRKEMNADGGIGKTEWDIKTLEFLENHHYYTSYCNDLLSKGKAENMDRLRRKIAEESIKKETGGLFTQKKQNDGPAVKQTNNLISKGIQTMLRTASSNHLRLSYMADRKAHILISVNAIIISVSISVLFRKFDESPYLMTPSIIFLFFSVITVVLSIIATRPVVTRGTFSKEDVINKKVNLLFFGNFYKASLEDYNWAMSIMMRDPDYLYGALIKDVYYLGVVLARKYKLLRLAYSIFMAGIVISVIAFTIAALIRSPESTTIITNPKNSPLQ